MDSYSHRRTNLFERRNQIDNEKRQNDISRVSDTSGLEMRKAEASETTPDNTGNIRTPGNLPPSMRPRKPQTRTTGMDNSDHGVHSKSFKTGDTADHLVSVHDNPFIREYGLDFVRNDSREEPSLEKQEGKVILQNGETEEEYGVNSGFVNKLRSKFAQLGNKQSTNLVSLSKRSASLENLLTVEKRAHPNRSARLGSGSRFSADDSRIVKSKPRDSTAEASKPVIKPEAKSSVARSAKPPVPRKQLSSTDYLTRRQKRNSTEIHDKPKPHEDHHWKVAPDLEVVGRDDIVIIDFETKTEKKTDDKENENFEVKDKKLSLKSLKDKDKQKSDHELPKPNTVLNFRSLFEQVITQNPEPVGHWRSSHSPTRTASGSDTQSPRIISPSPRSPLLKKTSDSVFEFSTGATKPSTKIETRKDRWSEEPVSPQVKESSPVSPRDENQSPAPSPRAQFGVPFSALEPEQSEDTDTVTSAHRKPKVSQFAEVFDSKSIVSEKKERPKRSKPPGSQLEKPPSPIKNDGVVSVKPVSKPPALPTAKPPSLPASKSSSLSPTQENKKIVSPTRKDINSASVPSDAVLTEANIKPSARKPKVSPRGAQIFDSSKMVKDERPPPKIPKQPVQPQVKTEVTSASTLSKQDKKPVETKEVKSVKAKAPSRPSYDPPAVSINGNNHSPSPALPVKNDLNKSMESPRVAKPIPAPQTQSMPFIASVAMTDNTSASPGPENGSKRGRSSYLTKMLNPNSDRDVSSSPRNEPDTNGTISSQLLNGSFPSPSLKKKQAPTPVKTSTDNVGKSPAEVNSRASEAELPRSSIDDIMNRKKKSVTAQPVCVFDSSNISNKRKEVPKRKPPKKTVEQLNKNGAMQPLVPILDLSSLTTGESSDYQEGYIPQKIEPCPIKFLGAEVKLSNSPFKKTRKAKVKISFDESASKTFEYEREEHALESWLQEHPEDREEVEQQIADEENSSGSGLSQMLDSVALKEQTDAVEALEYQQILDHSLKSNVPDISSGGEFGNYAPRMHVDFEFGKSLNEPEESNDYDDDYVIEEAEVDLQLRPADDNDLDAFSAEASSADLLF